MVQEYALFLFPRPWPLYHNQSNLWICSKSLTNRKESHMKRIKTHILPLAPTAELYKSKNAISDFRIYKKYLNAAFSQKAISNIAVTGNLGIGKSSIIRSFDSSKHCGKNRFLYVSLLKQGIFSEGENDKDKKQLEYDLLCQLLAASEESLLPNSTFRLIPQRKLSRQKSLVIIAAIIFVLVAYLLALKNEILSSVEESLSPFFVFDWIVANSAIITLGLYTILGVLLVYGTFGVSKYALSHKVPKRVKLSGNKAEFEMEFDPSLSYLDQYKFELIYALECIADKIDYTVVFEDIDRLEAKTCIEIFTKLRDINKLINTRLHPKHNMRFIYVFKDGIFEYTKQTKFFDYCLPIIPVLSTMNAAEELNLYYFNEINVKNAFDIAKVSAPYLTDFRTIHSVINDYRIFEEIELSRNGSLGNEWKKELLAFVIYKNLEPQDYDRIRNSCSVVFHTANEQLSNKELITALKDQNYLSGECLLFVGYSKEQLKLHYADVLKTGSYEEKKNNLDNDRKGLHLEILLDAIKNEAIADGKQLTQDVFSALFCGVEFSFLNYLLNYLVNSDMLMEQQLSILKSLNTTLYNSTYSLYEKVNIEVTSECEETLWSLLWKFDINVVYYILCYLFITQYWKTGSFDWFFSPQSDSLKNATDINKVHIFLRFVDMLERNKFTIPSTVIVVAQNWLTSLLNRELQTKWQDASLVRMIDIVYPSNTPSEIGMLELIIEGNSRTINSHLDRYREEQYWNYDDKKREYILVEIFQKYERLPKHFFSKLKEESKYANDQNKIGDFLYLWNNIGCNNDKDSISLGILKQARQWIAKIGSQIAKNWDANNYSLMELIDLIYPLPQVVPVELKGLQIKIGNIEKSIRDFLDFQYMHDYWKYTNQKRISILCDLVENNFWDSDDCDSEWFFADENISNERKLRDLLDMFERYDGVVCGRLNEHIRMWIDELVRINVQWKDKDIIQLIGYVYSDHIPTSILQTPITIKNKKKSIGFFLNNFKLDYYWNYSEKNRLDILKDLYNTLRYFSPMRTDWFFHPPKSSRYGSDQNKAGDFMRLCNWIESEHLNYKKAIVFLQGGYEWINTLPKGSIEKIWKDDSLVQMILRIEDNIPTGISMEIRSVEIVINGEKEKLDSLLRKAR